MILHLPLAGAVCFWHGGAILMKANYTKNVIKSLRFLEKLLKQGVCVILLADIFMIDE